MIKTANNLFAGLIELFFPRRCVRCGVFDVSLCDRCQRNLVSSTLVCLFCGNENNDGRTCDLCAPRYFLDGLTSAYSYHDAVIQTVIASFKYRSHRKLAPIIAGLMARGGAPAGDALVFIPLAAARRRERGYNQAELLARELARLTSLPFLEPPPLIKIRSAPQQAKAKSRQARFEQIKDAFALRKDASAQLRGKRIILVDDVATSGATLNEAARILKNGGGDGTPGAISVWGWVFAHG